jgi:hypothetical protein
MSRAGSRLVYASIGLHQAKVRPGDRQMQGRRIRLTDDHHRRLAAKGQRIGRRVLRFLNAPWTRL